MRVDQELVLSTGEVLAEFTDERLKQMSGNINRLAKNLGRTAHYERKNRSNIECIQGDLYLIQGEIERRRHLTVLIVCGLTWHWHGSFHVIEGRYESRNDVPLSLHRWAGEIRHKDTNEVLYWAVRHPVYEFKRESFSRYRMNGRREEQTMHLSAKELEDVRRRGARLDRLPDPLASPWKVADDAEDVPWIIAEDEDGADHP